MFTVCMCRKISSQLCVYIFVVYSQSLIDYCPHESCRVLLLNVAPSLYDETIINPEIVKVYSSDFVGLFSLT